MGASASRLDQLEELVRSLRAANAQLERQLSTVGKETDAVKRAELLSFIQAENGKMMRENERNQMQLADEVSVQRRRQRGVCPAVAGGVDSTAPDAPSLLCDLFHLPVASPASSCAAQCGDRLDGRASCKTGTRLSSDGWRRHRQR